MALQQKPKLHVYRELEQKGGFEEYLKYKKDTLLDCFSSSVRVPIDSFRSVVDMLIKVGPKNVLTVEFVRSLLSMFFSSVHHYDS